MRCKACGCTLLSCQCDSGPQNELLIVGTRTPGEWTSVADGEEFRIIAYDTYVPEVVATVHAVEEGDIGTNAKFLAAAPKLRNACVKALAALAIGNGNDAIEALKAALAFDDHVE